MWVSVRNLNVRRRKDISFSGCVHTLRVVEAICISFGGVSPFYHQYVNILSDAKRYTLDLQQSEPRRSVMRRPPKDFIRYKLSRSLSRSRYLEQKKEQRSVKWAGYWEVLAGGVPPPPYPPEAVGQYSVSQWGCVTATGRPAWFWLQLFFLDRVASPCWRWWSASSPSGP